MELLISNLHKVKVPVAGQRIYKDECIYSFDSPESKAGLYVCLNTFLGLGKDHVERYFAKTGNSIYLHIKRTKKPTKIEKTESPQKISRLAIDVEGGFHSKAKVEYDEELKLVVLPGFVEFLYPNQDLPEKVRHSITKLLESESASKLDELAAVSGTWDGEIRVESRHSGALEQLNNGVKIKPSGWKCQQCDLTENLWLNLTDGSILCGRKNWDGSGGNNHAIEYYEKMKFPLAVKLGTITSDGGADVYSYDEDDMVKDSNIIQHLLHFGINYQHMEKTEKTMAELEIELNQKTGEWATICESGGELQPVYGAAYTGMHNLGNSCYLNSVMQALFTLPTFIQRYYSSAGTIFEGDTGDPTNNFDIQMAKLASGLLSGKYSKPESDDDQPPGVTPTMFKNLIGKGHPDYSTKKQQDAPDFLLHMINLCERSKGGQENPANCMKFSVEDRVECRESKMVRYTYRQEYSLPFPIPVEKATNLQQVEEYEQRKAQGEKIPVSGLVRARISVDSCIEQFLESEEVTGYRVGGNLTTVNKTWRLSTFPNYLFLQLKKFKMAANWVPEKLDVCVEMPDTLDLSRLRGTGLQQTETQMPQTTDTQPEFKFDEAALALLKEMGFPEDACKRALHQTNNSGLEAATNWLMEHVGDADFSDPFVVPGTQTKKPGVDVSADSVAMLVEMGISGAHATRSLQETNNNLERAVDWYYSHMEELTQHVAHSTAAAAAATAAQTCTDGTPLYTLVAFISHMGTSTSCGHYVVHILKDGKWAIYNDEKVSISEHPPKDMGYLYLYRRNDAL